MSYQIDALSRFLDSPNGRFVSGAIIGVSFALSIEIIIIAITIWF